MSTYIRWPGSSSSSGIPTYANQASLPASAADGSAAITVDSDTLYIYSAGSTSWLAVASPASGGSLPNGKIYVGNASNVATAVFMSGDGTLDNSGALTISSVGGSSAANINTVTGLVTGSAVTQTELSYVVGVTSAIQTQLNGKQASGNYITSLTGDGTASGAGAAALTLATVNSNVGSFTNATLTVNAKGLITAASNGATPVTGISIASANGFAGSSSGGGSPALTISTSITGVLKGNATAISAATAGSDYSAGTAALATGILKSTTTTGALSIAVAGDFPTLNQNTTGTASNVTGTVAIANGGTGQTTANTALNALLPTQTSNSGKVLQTDGSNTSWASALTNPMTTGGDTIYGGASGTPTRLANGTAGQVFQSAGGTSAPTWSSVIGPTTGLAIVGTNTNNSASAGQVGELVPSSITTFTNFPTSGNWGDLTSISLTAGDWDIYCTLSATANTATSFTSFRLGFSTTAGNSTTGLVEGQTFVIQPGSTASNASAFIMNTQQLSATTTVYLKYRGLFSGGTAQATGTITARRRR